MSEMTIIPDLDLEGDSKQWKNWQAIYLDIKTCEDCRKKHGKIYNFSAKRYQPEHLYCRCSVIPMRTKEVGTIYENKIGLLPSKLGRVWREEDFDFVNGYRNSKRILYSNDGLIFVSFDHAQTFYELVK